MAEYNLFVNAEVNEANRKLENIDKKLDSIDKKAGNIDIKFPNLDQVVKGFESAGKAIKFVWDQSDGLLGSIHPLWGALGDVKDILGLITEGAEDFGKELVKLKKLMPTTIVGTGFETATSAINNTAQATARLGYVFFGLQQSVNLVAGTFNAFFDNTIRRQAELEATILQTRTTLASTARVLADGMEIRDPLQAIKALEGPIEETITNIRRRSLEIAGTTSEAIIQTFSVVAAQIGQIGGDLKDAEDLAISFAAALGTIGLSNPMYATQEIRSILTGNIDQNSVLARSLGITNEDVQKAKNSAEGLVSWLEKRLAAFGAGQKLAATQLSGVLSNVLEVYQEFTRELGKPLLEPLLAAANQVFTRLQSVFTELLNFAEAVGYAFTSLIGIVTGIVGSSNFNLISDQEVADGLNQAANLIGDFLTQIEDQIQSYIAPMLVRVLNNIKSIIDQLLPTVLKLVGAFAQFKIVQFEVIIDSLEYVTLLISGLSPLINRVLELYAGLMSQPLLQYFTQLGMYIQILEKSGVNAFARLGLSILIGLGSIKKIISAAKAAVTFILTLPEKISAGIKTTTTTIEANVLSVTTRIIQAVAQLGQIVLAEIAKLAGQARVALIDIATQAQASGTAIGASIAQGALVAADALKGLSTASAGAMTQMQKIEKNAPDIADALSKPYAEVKKGVVGAATAIKTQLITSLKALRATLIKTVKSMAFFSLQMAAITVALGVVLQAWSKYQAGVQNDKAIRIGIRANEKLATSLKNVTEESSKFMQMMRDRAIAQRNTAIEKLEEQIPEVSKKIKNAREELRKLQEQMASGNTGGPNSGFDLRFNLKADELKEQLKRLQDYRNQLEDLYRARAAEEQRKEDKKTIQILGKERTALEEKVKKEREKIERDLADYQFRLRQQIEQKAFAEREAKFRVELARLQQAQERAKEGMTGVARAVADILDEYNNELLRIEEQRQKREFDLKQQVARLEKDVADYAFKLEEQKAKIAKQVGEFNTKVADYVSEKKRRDREEEMQAAIRQNRIISQGFTTYMDDIEKYKNAAAARGLSATKILAFLYAGGAEKYNIEAGMDPEQVIETLFGEGTNLITDLFKPGGDITPNLRKFAENNGKPALAADAGLMQAQRDLGTSLTPPPPLVEPKIAKLSFEMDEFVEARRVANKQLIDAFKSLNATILKTDKALADLKLERLKSPALLSDLPSMSALEQQRDQTRLRLVGARAAGSLGARLDSNIFEPLLLELRKNSAIATINAREDMDEATKEKARQIVLENFNTQMKDINKKLELIKSNNGMEALIAFQSKLNEINSQALTPLIETATEALLAFTEFGSESERRVAQIKIESRLGQERIKLLRDTDLTIEEVDDSLAQMRKSLEATADRQEELRRQLEPLIERLRLTQLAAQTLTDAYTQAAKNLLGGQDYKEVSRAFAEALAGRTIDTFVEWIFKDMQKQFEDIFGELMGLDGVEEEIKTTLDSFKEEANINAGKTIDAIKALGPKFEKFVNDMKQATSTGTSLNTNYSNYDSEGLTPTQRNAIETYQQGDGNTYGPNTSANDPRYPIGQTVGGAAYGYPIPGQGGPNSGVPIQIPVEPFQEAANNIVPLTKNMTESAESLGRAAQQAAPEIAAAAEKTGEQATAAQNVQGALAGATQMLLGVGMVASGISQIQEGGTGNTLMGIGQVLLGVGSFGLGLARMPFFAEGGYVNAPTIGMIGEGGQGEYVIPENKMASSMQRYAQGVRGKEVVDGADLSYGSQNRAGSQPTALRDVSRRYNPGNNYNNFHNYTATGSASDNVSINITGEQLIFNEKNYVSQDEIPSIISQASKQGEARTLRKLRMSQSARTRAGI